MVPKVVSLCQVMFGSILWSMMVILTALVSALRHLARHQANYPLLTWNLTPDPCPPR